MGGSGSKTHTETKHHYHTEYVPDPETVAALEKAETKIENLEKEAMEMNDPNHFNNNVGKLFNNFIEKIQSLTLNDLIHKSPGEKHYGFIGPVTAGKTTMCNTMYGTTRPVALGHCTSECEVIYTNNHGTIVWDMFGADNNFRYYDPTTLSFIKGLDYCVVLFDSDIAMVSWIIKTVYAINPNSLIVVRTKVDQCKDDSERSIEEEKIMDGVKVQELLELEEPFHTFVVSSHNVSRGEREIYDWNKLREIVNPGEDALV